MSVSYLCMDTDSVRKLLEVIGGDIRRCENRTTWLHRISERTGLHYRIISGLWHGELPSKETTRVLKEAAKKNDHYIIERLLWNREVLLQTDRDFYREEIDRLWNLVCRIRDLNRGKG